jgi:hypothetical protein
VYNYTLFLYNYKLTKAYADRKLAKDANELNTQLEARGTITDKEKNQELTELDEK